jgi:hypothetical protein
LAGRWFGHFVCCWFVGVSLARWLGKLGATRVFYNAPPIGMTILGKFGGADRAPNGFRNYVCRCVCVCVFLSASNSARPELAERSKTPWTSLHSSPRDCVETFGLDHYSLGGGSARWQQQKSCLTNTWWLACAWVESVPCVCLNVVFFVCYHVVCIRGKQISFMCCFMAPRRLFLWGNGAREVETHAG